MQTFTSLHWTTDILNYWIPYILDSGYGVVQLVEELRYQDGRSRVRFPMVSMEFFIDTTFWLHYGPVVESASNRNAYQKYILAVKADGA